MSDDWRDGMHERRGVSREDPFDLMERRELEKYYATGQHMKFWPPVVGTIIFFVGLLLISLMLG